MPRVLRKGFAHDYLVRRRKSQGGVLITIADYIFTAKQCCKTIIVLCCMIFFGQEFGMGLAGWFSLGVSHALVVRCQLGHGLLKVHRAYMCIQDGGSQGFWLMPGAQLRLQQEHPPGTSLAWQSLCFPWNKYAQKTRQELHKAVTSLHRLKEKSYIPFFIGKNIKEQDHFVFKQMGTDENLILIGTKTPYLEWLVWCLEAKQEKQSVN